MFYFPTSPPEIHEKLADGINYIDGEYIANMLIPLTLDQARERAERFGITVPSYEFLGNRWKKDTPLYTCKHWNEETRLCSAYDSRPTMCAKYPYEGICEHCGWSNSTDETPIDTLLGGDADARASD